MAVTGISNFDDRAAIRAYRRDYLVKLCYQEGISITEQETKDQLILKMMGSGVDPNNPPRLADNPDAEDLAVAPQVNYGSKNVFELRKLCSERGIEWAKTDKRADLLAKLGVH